MTRILYWNVNNFSLAKIQGPAPWAADRLAYMLTNVMRGPNAGPLPRIPDMIVIVEVYSRVREVGMEGSVLGTHTNAGSGVLALLAAMRADATLGAGTDWRVVPPLNLGEFGQREAVAVFFNAATLQFTGPNLYYGIYGRAGPGQSQPVTLVMHANMRAYPAEWINAMPAAGRTTAFPGIGVIPEQQLAAEWQYYQAGAAPRQIPSPLPPAIPLNRIQFPNQGCRGPFFTRFNVVATGQTLKVFTVHTSPGSAPAAVAQLAHVTDIMTPPGANEVKVLLGDFNVDPFGPARARYNGLLLGVPGGIYTLALDPRVAHAGLIAAVRRPYCTTHLLSLPKAKVYNNLGGLTDAQHNVYPRSGYMGSNWRGLSITGAIDNILTAYGPGMLPGAANNITVVNTVTGTPYNAFPAPSPDVTAELRGGLPFATSFPGGSMLVVSPPASAGIGGFDPGSAAAAAQQAQFGLWQNFGKIISTSDHLPLMIDV